MAPKKRKAAAQPGWPKKAEEAAEAARAAAVEAGESEYTFKWRGSDDAQKESVKTMYIVNEPAPTIYGREVEENEGDRTTSRPSAQARKAKVRRVREHLVADGIDNDGWEEAGLLMPDEEKPEDTG
jgi:hypothetical protein